MMMPMIHVLGTVDGYRCACGLPSCLVDRTVQNPVHKPVKKYDAQGQYDLWYKANVG